MSRIIVYILTFLWALNSYGQEFGTHWISYPLPNDSSEVLFRHTYVTKTFPQQAYIHVSSTGKFKLYVNERNVSRSLMMDGMSNDTLISQTFDVRQYLRADSNVIAVWYAPGDYSSKGKQLSLEYYGINDKGKLFYHKADGDWWCKLVADCYVKGGKESFNAQAFIKGWNSTEHIPAKWLHPTGAFSDNCLTQKESMGALPPYTLSKIIRPISTHADSVGYHIDFGRDFYGTIRITLRGVKRGTVININDFQYVCNGETDEQAFPRFGFKRQRTFVIPESDNFKPKYITNIEGMEISPPPSD